MQRREADPELIFGHRQRWAEAHRSLATGQYEDMLVTQTGDHPVAGGAVRQVNRAHQAAATHV
jgi:hypothetical protein